MKKQVFIIIKPGFLKYSKIILDKFKRKGWNIVRIKTKKLLLSEAERLYSIHKKEKFYIPLCNYMSSDLSIGIIIEKQTSEDPFKEVDKIKDYFRKKYAESEMRNVLHSSDSQEHMDKEMYTYFWQ